MFSQVYLPYHYLVFIIKNSSLVQRVNSWIEEHAGICVVSCETITWTGRNYDHIYADKTYLVHGQRMLRGLRFVSL